MQEALPDLLQADSAVLDEADDDPHVADHLRVPRLGQNLRQLMGTLRQRSLISAESAANASLLAVGCVGWDLRRIGRMTLLMLPGSGATGNRGRRQTIAPLILDALFIRMLPIIGLTAPDRFPALVLLSAPKRTTDQVRSPMVAPMGKKEDAAMPAPDQAMPRQSLGSSHRPQELIVFQNGCPSFGLSVPVPAKLKKLRDPRCKKPKLALSVPTYCIAPSSYPTGTDVSRR